MTLTEKSLRFLDNEIKSRKEQKEYLSDVQGEHRENHSKGRELFLKLSEEIEIYESLKEMVLARQIVEKMVQVSHLDKLPSYVTTRPLTPNESFRSTTGSNSEALKEYNEFRDRKDQAIVPKSSSEKSFDGSEMDAYLHDEAGQKSNSAILQDYRKAIEREKFIRNNSTVHGSELQSYLNDEEGQKPQPKRPHGENCKEFWSACEDCYNKYRERLNEGKDHH